jgi:hypothetical protein
MVKRKNSTPEVAAARIIAIRDAARLLHIKTGGDQAECMFELLCAAILVCHEARPTKLPAEMLAEIAPHAAATVEHWFPDELKVMRRGDA